jgi:hypothetical protein
MRKIKFKLNEPEYKYIHPAGVENTLEILNAKVDRMNRNVPIYIPIDMDMKESYMVYITNIGLFKKDIKDVNLCIARVKKDMKSIRRTVDEFTALKKDLRALNRSMTGIKEELAYNIFCFDESKLFQLYSGTDERNVLTVA